MTSDISRINRSLTGAPSKYRKPLIPHMNEFVPLEEEIEAEQVYLGMPGLAALEIERVGEHAIESEPAAHRVGVTAASKGVFDRLVVIRLLPIRVRESIYWFAQLVGE